MLSLVTTGERIPAPLARWYASEYPALLRYALAVCRDRHVAEDLVQDAFLRACRAGADPEGAIGAYVRRTIVNLSRTRFHRRAIEQRALERAGAPGEIGPANERDDDVWDAIGALSPRQRAVLVLRFYEDLSEAQIADALGISAGNVKKHTARAVEKLRESLKQQGDMR